MLGYGREPWVCPVGTVAPGHWGWVALDSEAGSHCHGPPWRPGQQAPHLGQMREEAQTAGDCCPGVTLRRAGLRLAPEVSRGDSFPQLVRLPGQPRAAAAWMTQRGQRVWALPRDSKPVPSLLWASWFLCEIRRMGWMRSQPALQCASRGPSADPACPGTWEVWV